MTRLDVESLRSRFPGLTRTVGGRPAAFFDGPAGSQVPQVVIDAVSDYLAHRNANVGGAFATTVETGAMFEDVKAAMVDFFGASGDGDEIVFGANMTSLTYDIARALSATWSEGDEIVVTRLDHDANVTPWVTMAEQRGVTVRYVDVVDDDVTLDMDSFGECLTSKTRLVAVGAASNLVGSINPLRDIVARAHGVGALVYVDAVHYAAHRELEVGSWGADLCVCSAYKFFGPHVGVLWARRELLEQLPAEKLRPSPDAVPWRWMRGTQNHECIAGTGAAVAYLEDVGRLVEPSAKTRREALCAAFAAIVEHENELCLRLIEGLQAIDGVRVVGVSDPRRIGERCPTVSFRPEHVEPKAVEQALAEQGIFVWAGHSYAIGLSERLGLEPSGVVRAGVLHYNTAEEVDRLVEAVRQTCS